MSPLPFERVAAGFAGGQPSLSSWCWPSELIQKRISLKGAKALVAAHATAAELHTSSNFATHVLYRSLNGNPQRSAKSPKS
jgi:hypothetical protein